MNGKDPDEWDEGIRFFAGVILALPWMLAIWIAGWCIFSTVDCLRCLW